MPTNGPTEYQVKSLEAGRVFTPAAPIASREWFTGRADQVRRVVDAIHQVGQHVVLYGERGVGKTSLANVVAPLFEQLGGGFSFAKVNCDRTDDFSSVMRKALGEIALVPAKPTPGFERESAGPGGSLAKILPRKVTPNDVRVLLQVNAGVVVILDEFDRLAADARAICADLIKTLSDYAVPATVVLVGVADTVDDLIDEHGSVDRALVQVPMPRMRADELGEILSRGAEQLGVKLDDGIQDRIVALSQGLPHFTHLIGLCTVRAALERETLTVDELCLEEGLQAAVENTRHTIQSQYHKATTSARAGALFEQVLLACAVAPRDELNGFSASDLLAPMEAITGKRVRSTSFARHLRSFCSQQRGHVLERKGSAGNYSYRFRNPLIEPYVIMRGLTTELLSPAKLMQLSSQR